MVQQLTICRAKKGTRRKAGHYSSGKWKSDARMKAVSIKSVKTDLGKHIQVIFALEYLDSRPARTPSVR